MDLLIYGSSFPFHAPAEFAASRELVVALDSAGFDFIAAGAHIISQPPGTYSDRPSENFTGPYYDVFVLLAYAAAITSRIRLMSAIIILPALPTVLVAKQAAELAFFSGGRFDLGLGISWNAAEYRAMGQTLHDRGRRFDEQIEVLGRLWTEPFVTMAGDYHTLEGIGLNRLPAAPIPLWLASGLTSEKSMRRVARVATGWIPKTDPAAFLPFGDPGAEITRMRGYVEDAGRNPAALQIVTVMSVDPGGSQAWVDTAGRLLESGITHLRIDPPSDLPTADAVASVIDARARLVSALG